MDFSRDQQILAIQSFIQYSKESLFEKFALKVVTVNFMSCVNYYDLLQIFIFKVFFNIPTNLKGSIQCPAPVLSNLYQDVKTVASAALRHKGEG